jgi:hypothetical protein
MPRLSIPMAPERDIKRPPLKPFLPLALATAVLAFCTILSSRLGLEGRGSTLAPPTAAVSASLFTLHAYAGQHPAGGQRRATAVGFVR